MKLAAAWRTIIHDDAADQTLAARSVDDYVTALKLSMRCLARPNLSTSSKQTHVIRAHVRFALATFTRLLTTPIWKTLCRHHKSFVRYNDILTGVANLREHEHSRDLVTIFLVEDLEEGLKVLKETLANDGLESYYVQMCEEEFKKLKSKMAPASHEGTVPQYS